MSRLRATNLVEKYRWSGNISASEDPRPRTARDFDFHCRNGNLVSPQEASADAVESRTAQLMCHCKDKLRTDANRFFMTVRTPRIEKIEMSQKTVP